ncbi:MAG: hypothetical protein ACXVCP_14680 [Bdellovibrio sp.]
MKIYFRWILFFLICFGVGFLHGILPKGISKRNILTPTKIEILSTDEIFLPEKIRQQIEQEFNVKISFTVTRDWDRIIAQMVATPGADLIFLPSYWAHNLAQQGLLADVSGTRKILQQKIAPDFVNASSLSISSSESLFYFLPFFWMKTEILSVNKETFPEFLTDKKESLLYLLADEDLLLKHFQTWKEQKYWDLISQKKILTMPLDRFSKELPKEGAVELRLEKERLDSKNPPLLSALLIWGAAIPVNSAHKSLVLDILDSISNAAIQEQNLLNTPFNTTFTALVSDQIPLNRRASFIRDIQIKDTLLIESKDQHAKTKLKDEFNFTL